MLYSAFFMLKLDNIFKRYCKSPPPALSLRFDHTCSLPASSCTCTEYADTTCISDKQWMIDMLLSCTFLQGWCREVVKPSEVANAYRVCIHTDYDCESSTGVMMSTIAGWRLCFGIFMPWSICHVNEFLPVRKKSKFVQHCLNLKNKSGGQTRRKIGILLSTIFSPCIKMLVGFGLNSKIS